MLKLLTLITFFTFTWSQFVWSIGVEPFIFKEPEKTQKIFALDAQKISAENSCANSIKSSEKPLILALNTLKMLPKINTGLGHNDDLGRMTGYTEILNQFGFNDASQANLLFMGAKLWENAANVNADLLKTTTTTKRSEITYNALNQITGYTDVIASPDGTKQSVTMYNMTYLPTGELNGYTQTSTEYENQYDENGNVVGSKAKESQTTKIDRTTYDSLGRVVSKTGTIDGEDYSYEVRSFDAVGRPVQYIETQGDAEIVHFGILFDSLGRVSEEYIKTSASQGTWIFESEEKSLIQYRYTYDQYGKRDTSYENEIYHEVSSNPLGTILKAIVSIVTIAVTWGMATPFVAAVMAVENFAFSVLSGADILQAAIGAAISFAAAYIGAELGSLFGGGTSAATGTATETLTGIAGFLKEGGMTMLFQGLSLADSLMVDNQGRGLFEQVFGKWGSVVFEAISVIGGLMAGGKGATGPPYQLYASIGRLAVSAMLTALGDSINPYLRQFISGFANSFLNAWANAKTANYNQAQKEAQGFKKEIDPVTGKAYWVKDDISNRTILNENGSINRMEILDEYGNTQYSLTPSEKIAGGFEYRDTQGNFLYTTSINPHGGGMDYYDQAGIKRLSLYTTGWTEIFDSVGKSYALIPPNAEIAWGDNGTIKESYIEYDNYTEYYTKEGTLNGRIVEGYTALKQGDQIIGQYKDTTDNTYIYRDASGRFVNKITITPDGGVLATDGKWTTSYSNANIKEWTKANVSNSPIYYYDKLGQDIEKIRYTSLDPSGAVQGFMEHNLKTGDYDFLDPQGNKLIPTINPQEIVNNTKDLSNYIASELTNAIRQGQIDISKELQRLGEGSNFFMLDEFSSDNGGTLIAGLRALPLMGGVSGAIQQLLFNVVDGGQDIAFQRLVNLAKSGDKVVMYADKFDNVTQAKFNNLLNQIQSSGLSKDFNISYNAITVDNLLNNLKQTLQMDENGVIHANLQENPAAALAYEQYQNLIKVFPEGTPNLGQKLIIGFNFERKPLLMPDVVATYMGVEYLPTMTFKATGVPWKDTFLTLSADLINSAGYLVNGVTYTTYRGLELAGIAADLPVAVTTDIYNYFTGSNILKDDIYAYITTLTPPQLAAITEAMQYLKIYTASMLPTVRVADGVLGKEGIEDILILGRGPKSRLESLAAKEGGRISTIDSNVAKEIFKNNYSDMRKADKIIQYMDNIPTTLDESLDIGGQFSRAEKYMIDTREDLFKKTIRKREN